MHGRRAGALTERTAPRPRGHVAGTGALLAGGLAFVMVAMSCVGVATAAPLSVEEGAIGGVLRTLEAPGSTEAPVIHQTDEGYIRFLGAPSGGTFVIRDTGAKTTSAAGKAAVFIGDHGDAFGATSGSTGFRTGPLQSREGFEYVRLNQYYEDIPVFGAQVVVQLNDRSGVQNVLSDIMRDTRALDDGSISLTPTLSGPQALAAAINAFAAVSETYGAGDYSGVGGRELLILRPSVVGLAGATRLVWRVELAASGDEPVHSVVLVDAHSGQIALQYSLFESALDRQIFDADGGITIPDTPTRAEGEGATGIEAVDDVYDFFGDTYDFFFVEHGYDSYDDNGSPIVATVNVPFLNACWGCSLDPSSTSEGNGTITEMLFGTGFAVDDVVAHELTHGVTQFTSGLSYFGFSGAINESLSDMWGEWVDQTNGSANDTEANRWIIGEDLDPFISFLLGGSLETPGIRSMKDPTVFGDPDRLGSEFLRDVNSFQDNGGIHSNSGIGNKLCYLLTDGDTFNGQTVTGMGVSAAADLFFGTQFLLSPASDYNDLFLALGAVALDLGLSFEERLNIANAGKAVEIIPESLFENGLRDFRAVSTMDTTGNPVIALNWSNPDSSLFTSASLLRSITGFPTNFGDGEIIAEGTISQYLDEEVTEGTTYFYSVIVDLTSGLPQVASAQATAGEASSSALTESFGDGLLFAGGANTVDLGINQLVFTPVGGPVGPFGSGSGSGSFNNYEATILPSAFSLPVAREDSEGRAFDVTSPQDSGVIVNLGEKTFPFFGQAFSQLYVAANGYVSFQPIATDDDLNFPSLASHFAIPRISYFFAGTADLLDTLASSAGGSMWLRLLDDRVVVTYENVPQFNPFSPESADSTSTIQTEMFYSGMIRITYLDAVATAAVVGLSDGRGVPVDPADLFPGVVSSGGLTDLSELPDENVLLRIEPVSSASADAGGLIDFLVTAIAPSGSVTTPVLTGEWNGPGGLRFADNGNGTGTFSWQTELADAGTYQFRVTAAADGQLAYQDIAIQVCDVLLLPEASELAVIADEPGEDPTLSRAVRTESSLTAMYTYSHPLQTGEFGLYDEGASVVYWYRNNQIVTSLTNRLQVSPQATRGGDSWYFGVVPVTLLGLAGPIEFSPIITISALPEIVSITPAVGSVQGGERIRIRGNRLGAPVAVTFGGVHVGSIEAISQGEIEVVAPLHGPGAVDVVVTTTDGDGILENGYTYLGEGESVAVIDVNGDGKVDAVDVQLVVNAVLTGQAAKSNDATDVNRDGQTNATDIQMVVNKALLR